MPDLVGRDLEVTGEHAWRVLRVTEQDVFVDLDGVVARIAEAAAQRP